MPHSMQPESSRDERVMCVFLEAIETIGGSGALVTSRRMDWLPDLLQAAYIIVRQEEEHRTPEEIAAEMGVTMETIESVLSAPTDAAVDRLKVEPPDEQAEREYVAGGVARIAWNHLHS